MAFRTGRMIFSLVIFSFMPLLVACPKKDPPPVDAAPPPPPPPAEDATAVLIPLEDDAGDAGDGDADAGKKAVGPGVPTNVARLRQCCAAIRHQAQGAPELIAAATTCDQLAAQAGPTGNAPELGALRSLFGGRTIPPVCAGF
jgi:hypothetical protein